MAYKQHNSPFHNAYSNPNTVKVAFANSKIDIDYAGLNADGATDGTTDDPSTDPDDLKKEGKKDYPNLQRRMKNAKNEKRRQKIAGKINKRQIKDKGKATRMDLKQNVKEDNLQKKQVKKINDAYDKQALKFDDDAAAEKVLGKRTDRTDPFTKSPNKMKTPLNYLNPNTLEVQGDAGQSTDVGQENTPNRAGRPINSNVLMNDPTNYQDPSKVSAQQNAQEQMFSGLAQSMGDTNPEPTDNSMGDNNTQSNQANSSSPHSLSAIGGFAVPTNPQSITPGQQSPFNQVGDGKKEFQKKTGFKDLNEQENAIATGNADWKGHKAGHSLNKVKEKYGSPAKKKNWIQDVNKDIERRGTKGVCTGDKFGSESCPPGSKRYNLAKTFRKMNKK